MSASSHRERNKAGRSRHAGVLLALIVGGAALVLQAAPAWSGSLQWTRHVADPSSLWRWLTGHLTHWSWDHLRWDLGAFALLSFMGLRLAPQAYAACLALAAVMIPLEIRFGESQIDSYRGLSGIDSALLGLLVAALWFHPAEASRPGRARLLAILGGGGFVAKTVFELGTGGTLFVANEHREFVPVIAAHLTGFLSGILASAARINRNDPGRGSRTAANPSRLATCRLRIQNAPR
jgi:rhomboid family GlyGly-CTERM serine protease